VAVTAVAVGATLATRDSGRGSDRRAAEASVAAEVMAAATVAAGATVTA
jgi:hypothetical protein